MNFIQLSSTDSLTLKISHLPFYSTPIMWLCNFCLGQIQVAFSSFFRELAKITIQVCHKIFNSSVTVQSMACTVAVVMRCWLMFMYLISCVPAAHNTKVSMSQSGLQSAVPIYRVFRLGGIPPMMKEQFEMARLRAW